MAQKFYQGIDLFDDVLNEIGAKKFFLVCDASFDFLSIKDAILSSKIKYVMFNSFTANPLHSDADIGRALFEKEQCDVIVAVGGGSSMDVAKCIKLDSQKDIPIIAIPTTAGTGSESTRHIVVYKDGKKESLGNESVIPNIVIFEPMVLKTLPLYQKKCTMLDALCQGIESYWSINATDETRVISKKAICTIVAYMDDYILNNSEEAFAHIMQGANYSGQAINITQTTAAHAMSYKITSMYKLPHGHAVAICLPIVWSKMINKADNKQIELFNEIANALGCESYKEAIEWFKNKLALYGINSPKAIDNKDEEVEVLTNEINLVRLKNNPIVFDKDEIRDMYKEIIQ